MKKLKSGRPKGSKSCVAIRMKELTKYLTPYSVVMVGASWLENSGYNIKKSKVVDIESVTLNNDNVKIEVKDLDLT